MKLEVEVGAGRASRLLAAAPQEFGEQVVAFGEVGVALAALIGMTGGARVFAIISLARRRLFGPRGVDLAGVVALSLVRIRQEVVGGRDLLELLLRVLVARIEIRVQLLGELPVGFADFLRGRGLGDAEDVIGVWQDMASAADRRAHA